ncbi:hypothetical protein C8R46DRAFT_392884 [Mycena filopes]|nr:hypothetical protein C8R46DRAFT_392884 [Mycena filopes]
MFDDQPEYDVYYDSPMDQETPVVHDDYNPAAHPDWRNELSFPGPSSAGHMFQSATHVGFHGSQEFNNVAGNLNIYPTTTYAMPLGSNNSPYTGTPHLQALSVENPPLSTSRDALGSVCSDSASYCSHLLRQGRGFPLYVPGPQKNLPEEYRRTGITIGDVGRITPEGVFDFFFNIYLDGDHAVNADFVPGDFSPLRRSIPRDIINVEFDPGNYVASAFIQAWDPNAISGEFPGSEFLFSCQGPSGAVLALPHGARLEKLEDVEHVRQYAACHAESWYKYINGTRGRALTNGSLYLITGCEKSASGGIASFQNVAPGAEFQLSFRPTAHADDDYRYRFVRGTPARTKHFDVSARSDEGTLNQTTFLHGFSISLGEGIWGRLFGVKVREIADSEMQDARSDFVPFGLQGSLSSWSFNFFGGGSGAGGEKYTDNTGDELTMSDFVPTSVVVHPGQLINTCLLRECPEARVVITHDDDWRDVLRDACFFFQSCSFDD